MVRVNFTETNKWVLAVDTKAPKLVAKNDFLQDQEALNDLGIEFSKILSMIDNQRYPRGQQVSTEVTVRFLALERCMKKCLTSDLIKGLNPAEIMGLKRILEPTREDL